MPLGPWPAILRQNPSSQCPRHKGSRIDLSAICVLRSGEGFLDGADFFRRDACFFLAALAGEHCGSNSQPRGSEIMPSATPSFASHRFMSASMKSERSLSVRNLSICGLPEVSLGAAWLYATGIHWPMARLERPVRMAGSPKRFRRRPLDSAGKESCFAPASGAADEIGVHRGLL